MWPSASARRPSISARIESRARLWRRAVGCLVWSARRRWRAIATSSSVKSPSSSVVSTRTTPALVRTSRSWTPLGDVAELGGQRAPVRQVGGAERGVPAGDQALRASLLVARLPRLVDGPRGQAHRRVAVAVHRDDLRQAGVRAGRGAPATEARPRARRKGSRPPCRRRCRRRSSRSRRSRAPRGRACRRRRCAARSAGPGSRCRERRCGRRCATPPRRGRSAAHSAATRRLSR